MAKGRQDNPEACADCGRDTAPLIRYAEWSHMAPCVVETEDGVRDSLEAVYKPSRRLCFACYRAAVNAERKAA